MFACNCLLSFAVGFVLVCYLVFCGWFAALCLLLIGVLVCSSFGVVCVCRLFLLWLRVFCYLM